MIFRIEIRDGHLTPDHIEVGMTPLEGGEHPHQVQTWWSAIYCYRLTHRSDASIRMHSQPPAPPQGSVTVIVRVGMSENDPELLNCCVFTASKEAVRKFSEQSEHSGDVWVSEQHPLVEIRILSSDTLGLAQKVKKAIEG